MEKEFKIKFQELYKKIEGKFSKEKETFDELERILQRSFNEFSNKIDSKLIDKCKDEYENLYLYSGYEKNSKSRESKQPMAVPLPGYEQEYNEGLSKLNECREKYSTINQQLDMTTNIINSIVLNSHNTCLRECENDTLKHKHSESKLGRCIESCLKYRNYNIQSNYKMLFDLIDEYQNIADKL